MPPGRNWIVGLSEGINQLFPYKSAGEVGNLLWEILQKQQLFLIIDTCYFHLFRPLLVHRPWSHWYIMDSRLIPIDDQIKWDVFQLNNGFDIQWKLSFYFFKLSIDTFALVIALCLTKPMWRKMLFPQSLVRRTCPSFEARRLLLWFLIIPSAQLITIAVFTTALLDVT